MISTKEMRHHIRAPDYSNAWREKSEQIISYAANLIDAAEDLKREVADLTAKLAAAEDRTKELVSLLEEARDDCNEVLNTYLPNAGWERYDKRIAYQKHLIARIDAAIEAEKGRE